jgi:hypothetical protein
MNLNAWLARRTERDTSTVLPVTPDYSRAPVFYPAKLAPAVVRAERYAGPGRPPKRTEELTRIVSLDRRDLSSVRYDLTERLRIRARPCKVCQRCITDLRDVQVWALAEAEMCGGLFGMIGVGWGKTLITQLLPTIFEETRSRPLVIIPPNLRTQFAANLADLKRHWRVSPRLRMLAYSQLSRPESSGLLEKLAPDLIICDEAHALKRRDSARTKRFLRYYDAHPQTAYCLCSGSFTTKSLEDYGHLLGLALRNRSPLPRGRGEVASWASALDEKPRAPAKPGALCLLGETQKAQRAIQAAIGKKARKLARAAYRMRLVQTHGVVATDDQSATCSLELQPFPFNGTPKIRKALEHLDRTWCTPGGEELEDALAKAAAEKELTQGFYYEWVWPNGEADEAWLEARANWHREIRHFLQGDPPEGYDSPFLVTQAVLRIEAHKPKPGDKRASHMRAAWRAWDEQRHKPEPKTRAVWFDRSLIHAAQKWGEDNEGIIWSSYGATTRAFEKLGCFPVFGPGPQADRELGKLAGSRSAPATIVASMAHAIGKNLQRWSNNLVLCPPSSGKDWEQLLGRTHRQGQEADLVTCYVTTHADTLRDAFSSARALASYTEETTGTRQKLCAATVLIDG